jgi:hypothetical protein
VIVSVAHARVDEAAEAADRNEPEVIKKGKPGDE